MALLPLIVAPLLVAALPAADVFPHAWGRNDSLRDVGAGDERVDGRLLGRYLVRFEDTVRNETDVVLRDVRSDVLLPESGPGQRVSWVRLSPDGWTLRRDAEEQWTAFAECASLAPGEAVTFGWLASVELLEPPSALGGEPGASEELGEALRVAALADDPILRLTDPIVVAAAEVVRASATSSADEDLVSAARAYVSQHVRYELDGGWRPAPDVLSAGRGSCSETTFAFVAICRRLGVPARWTGGSLLRHGVPGRAVDASFHRVAEVFLARRGWVPIETTDPEGELPARMLVLSRTASGRGATGLYYHARNEWRSPEQELRPRSTKRAYWVDASQAVSPTGDPLAGLRVGHRASFARCELLLAESEGYGPPIASGLLGLSPSRSRAPVRSLEECRDVLVAAAHPGVVRVLHRLARTGAPHGLPGRATIESACGSRLAADLLPLLEQSPAAFEAWWAGASTRVAPQVTVSDSSAAGTSAVGTSAVGTSAVGTSAVGTLRRLTLTR